ncbi:hypothetical protein [Neobacillus soli]|uniref:hypothetical protein n=1 Tax=Neobacillus soli TaxID=220688 RepID=UPI0008242C4F|nr:hypothetical protein [Neobacillus soli]
MKDYFIRLIFGLLTFMIVSGIASIFNIDRIQFGKPVNNFILLIIFMVGGWGGWYLYKASKKNSNE